MINTKKNIAIIPCAGKPKISLFPNTYDPLIPINGVPSIKYIIESLKFFDKIYIVLNKKDIKSKKFLELIKNDKIKILEPLNYFKGIGDSIYSVIKELDENCSSITINLGDTIYKNNSIPRKDTILVSTKEKLESSNWDYITENENVIIKKPKNYQKGYITCGIYSFTNVKLFKNIFKKFGKDKKITITDLLEEYIKFHKFNFKFENNDWFDLGHLEGFYSAKIAFLRKRGFNSLEYDEFKGVITKKSKNNKKIFLETNWYLNLPPDLKVFAPRIVDYNLNQNDTFYSIEFYGYPTLSDLFLYGDLSQEHWQNIFLKIFELLKYLNKNHKTELTNKTIIDIYKNKTLERVNLLKKQDFFRNLINFDTLSINGTNFKNYPKYINYSFLDNICKTLTKESIGSVIHGDLCFSNILFDIYSGIIKIIDPRGQFGDIGILGDLNYDLAKLRHSVHGNYEAIISDLFVVKNFENKFEYSMLNNNSVELVNFFDKLIVKNKYNLTIIKFIEGLLYLTMIPLHSDSFERQKLMYLRSVELFNEIGGDFFENSN
jgi:dTDP-glucose pyrophosphorylase